MLNPCARAKATTTKNIININVIAAVLWTFGWTKTTQFSTTSISAG